MVIDTRTPIRTMLYLRLGDLILCLARGAVRRRLMGASRLAPALNVAKALARAAMRTWRSAPLQKPRRRRLQKRSVQG